MLNKPVRPKKERNPAETRGRLIGATVQLILKQGFAATSVDQICAEAGVTKGSFFHHFENKDAIGRAAIQWWGDFGTQLYAEAWKDETADPLAQVHHMLDIMSGFTQRPEVCTCVVGMLSQEMAQSNPVLRGECAHQLDIWTANMARMLQAAKERHQPSADFEPAAAAWFLNSLWQGSMLVGKTRGEPGPAMIRQNLQMAHAWVDALFTNTSPSA